MPARRINSLSVRQPQRHTFRRQAQGTGGAKRTAPASPLADRLRDELIARLADRADVAHARGLKRLVGLLEGDEGPERQRSAECEATVAIRLLSRGAHIQFEVPTSAGRTADFLVRIEHRHVALHVKRWAAPRERDTVTLRVPEIMRAFERVRRPYLVGVRWPSVRTAFDRFIIEGSRFLYQASVGDEWVFRDEQQVPCGGLRILAPWPGDRVVLTVGLDATLESEIARIHRLLRKAHAQFATDIPNVIALIGGTRADERLIDRAIFGSHVERWDLFPPRGQRVAHGRGDDGFWSGERYTHSRAIAWSTWSDTRGMGATRLWFRSRADADSEIRSLLGA
jgi:hypothetical protein